MSNLGRRKYSIQKLHAEAAALCDNKSQLCCGIFVYIKNKNAPQGGTLFGESQASSHGISEK